MEPPFFCISQEYRIDKRILVKEQLTHINKTCDFFEAYDETNTEVKDAFNLYSMKYILQEKKQNPSINNISAIGIIFSTIELFKHINTLKEDRVGVLEDDIYLHNDFFNITEKINSDISNCNFDVLYLGYNNKNTQVNESLQTSYDVLFKLPNNETLGFFYGCYGYICNRKFREFVVKLGTQWFIDNDYTIDQGFNVIKNSTAFNFYIVSGEQLLIPEIYDDDCINKNRQNKNMFYTERAINLSSYHKLNEPRLEFVFIIPSYNCEEWIVRNLNSIIEQTYTKWRIIYINDNSSDKTHEMFLKLTEKCKEKVTYIQNDVKYGQAFNRYQAYMSCRDDEICVLLDGDDWLYHKFCLKYIAYFMKINDVDITYGLESTYEYGKIKNSYKNYMYHKNDYDNYVVKNKLYRYSEWLAGHLRVMKAKYLKNINISDFLDTSLNFFKCSTDMVESYCCLEQCDKRHKKLDEVVVVYNKDNSIRYGTSWFKDEIPEYREMIRQQIRKTPVYSSDIERKKDILVVDIEKQNYKQILQYYYDKRLFENVDLLLVKQTLIHLYKDLLDKYSDLPKIEVSITNKNKNIIIRILGNDLEQIHGENQTYENLKFILDNESQFTDTDKLFVLNKIIDTGKKKIIIELLEQKQVKYVDIPFIDSELPELEHEDLIISLIDKYTQTGELSWQEFEFLSLLLNNINKFFIDINTCRNYCILQGKLNNLYEWIFVLDSNSFFTDSMYYDIVNNISNETQYITIPQISLKACGLTNEDICKISDTNKYEKFEHQLCFHRTSNYNFNETLQYGNMDKAEFLNAMNVVGPWRKRKPMFDIKQRKFTELDRCLRQMGGNNKWLTLSAVISIDTNMETNDISINKYQLVMISLYRLYEKIKKSQHTENKQHSYIIHMSSAKEREGLVKKITELFNAIVYEAIVIKGNGVAGCLASHNNIYKLIPEGDDLLIFEDDCEIIDDSFKDIITQNKQIYDIMYIGTHDTFIDINGTANGSWGSHAMWISSKAIKLFLNYNDNQNPVDHIWNEIERIYKLRVWRPFIKDKYVKQKTGLISCITNTLRC
jgi:glycosyltransferase involved in cell wall biosynthesis/GR25 family glycosyltransferase involved in LPS biosynthesis